MLNPDKVPKLIVPTPIGGVRLIYAYNHRVITLPEVYLAEEFVQPLTHMLSMLHERAGVTSVLTYGVYDRRKERGSTRWSQHAYASAIDIGGLNSDHIAYTVRVLDHWRSPRWRTLWALVERACRLASAGHDYLYLTPDTNRLHADHLHWGIWPRGTH